MAYKIDKKRNRKVVYLRDVKCFTFQRIADIHNLAKSTVHEIYTNEKKRNELSTAIQK